MAQREFSPEERQLLREALQSYLSDLHTEISHTYRLELREMLKHRQACLQHVLDDLNKAEPISQASPGTH